MRTTAVKTGRRMTYFFPQVSSSEEEESDKESDEYLEIPAISNKESEEFIELPAVTSRPPGNKREYHVGEHIKMRDRKECQ